MYVFVHCVCLCECVCVCVCVCVHVHAFFDFERREWRIQLEFFCFFDFIVYSSTLHPQPPHFHISDHVPFCQSILEQDCGEKKEEYKL